MHICGVTCCRSVQWTPYIEKREAQRGDCTAPVQLGNTAFVEDVCQNDIIADVRRKATTEAEWRRGPAEWAEPDATRLFYQGVELAFGVKIIRAPPCMFHLRCSI